MRDHVETFKKKKKNERGRKHDNCNVSYLMAATSWRLDARLVLNIIISGYPKKKEKRKKKKTTGVAAAADSASLSARYYRKRWSGKWIKRPSLLSMMKRYIPMVAANTIQQQNAFPKQQTREPQKTTTTTTGATAAATFSPSPSLNQSRGNESRAPRRIESFRTLLTATILLHFVLYIWWWRRRIVVNLGIFGRMSRSDFN